MIGWLTSNYLWIKALHIIFVIAWLAGLLYLPRLYVYHAEATAGSDRSATFALMERRLLHGIMAPAMIGTYLFGIMLAVALGRDLWHSGWIWAKLALVLFLTVFHYQLACWRRAFAAGLNRHAPRFFRAVNELPTLAMIGIVILVVVKPF